MNTYMVTPTGATLYHDGQHHVVPTDHVNYARIVDSLKAKDFAGAVSLIDIRSEVKRFISSSAEFTLEGDLITYQGRPFTPMVSNKVLAMIDAGNDAEPLFNFLRKVRKNPSATAQKELFLFVEANRFMIHEDGDILAYKSVRNDYMDIHSGTVLYAVGTTVEMERGNVDDDRDRTCSFGLHFAAHDYATTWAGSNNRLLLIKIDPADVVSIPSDYNNQKGRTCRLTVVAEIASRKPLPEKEVYTNSDIGVEDESDEGDSYDAEYDKGYDLGVADAQNGHLDRTLDDKSIGFKDGYDDGFNEF